MLALLPSDGRDPPVRLQEAPEPARRPDEALVAVEAFSINRGETFLLERPRPGLRPGKDVAGRVAGRRRTAAAHAPASGWSAIRPWRAGRSSPRSPPPRWPCGPLTAEPFEL
jgi:hypothetical protein